VVDVLQRTLVPHSYNSLQLHDLKDDPFNKAYAVFASLSEGGGISGSRGGHGATAVMSEASRAKKRKLFQNMGLALAII
jgi:hypothetical protein